MSQPPEVSSDGPDTDAPAGADQSPQRGDPEEVTDMTATTAEEAMDASADEDGFAEESAYSAAPTDG